MRDTYSNDVEAAAYLAREDPWAPCLDDRPTLAELEAEEEADRRFEQRREDGAA